MLDDLSSYFDEDKRTDLTKRLNNKRVEQSLPAEMELAILWMVKDCERLEIEPYWWANGKKPDALVDGLIPNIPAIVEIAAVADNSMSGEEDMDAIANTIMEIANKAERTSGSFLHFMFGETGKYERGKLIRGIAAPKNYRPSGYVVSKIRDWIISGRSQKEHIKLEDSGLIVVVERRPYKQRRYHNIHTSRPPMTYSNTRNPIYTALSDKLAQVEHAPSDTWRIILLADAGSQALSELTGSRFNLRTPSHSTAESIINRFLSDKSGRVDAVVALVPIQEFRTGISSFKMRQNRWEMRLFGTNCATNLALEGKLKDLIANLPTPHNNGHNARSLTIQNAMRPESRGQYMGTTMTTDKDLLTFRMSSRVLQDFLAKRITENQFRSVLGDRKEEPHSAFDFLDHGYLFKSIRIEHGGLDEDDDHLIFEFQKDASVKPFE